MGCDNAVVLVNNAVAYTGRLQADTAGKSVILTYTDGTSYIAGRNNGIGLAAKNISIIGETYEWAVENGQSGITVTIPEYSKFVPISIGVEVLLYHDANITINTSDSSSVSILGRSFYAYKILDVRTSGDLSSYHY
jgi:hypothetical protein